MRTPRIGTSSRPGAPPSSIAPIARPRGRLGSAPLGLDSGARLALGTDSFSHDLFEDLRLGSLLIKTQTGSVGRVSASDVLGWTTVNGAAALRRDDLGSLAPGSRGDLLVVDVSAPATWPPFDLLRSLVYYGNAGALRHSLVDGQPIVQDGRAVHADLDRLRKSVAQSCEKLEHRPGPAGPARRRVGTGGSHGHRFGELGSARHRHVSTDAWN